MYIILLKFTNKLLHNINRCESHHTITKFKQLYKINLFYLFLKKRKRIKII